MDLCQPYNDLKKIVGKFVKHQFVQGNVLLEVVQGYNFYNGKGMVGGLFPHKFLRKCQGYREVFESMKLAL